MKIGNIELAGYEMIRSARTGVVRNPDDVWVWLGKAPDLRIGIGERVLDSLRWQQGDKIVADFSKDHEHLVLMRRPDRGWTFRRENKSRCGRVIIRLAAFPEHPRLVLKSFFGTTQRVCDSAVNTLGLVIQIKH